MTGEWWPVLDQEATRIVGVVALDDGGGGYLSANSPSALAGDGSQFAGGGGAGFSSGNQISGGEGGLFAGDGGRGSSTFSVGGGGGGGAGLGGAIFNFGGTVTAVNSTISGNLARGGRRRERYGPSADRACPIFQETVLGFPREECTD